ncbi:VC0807 family protein [Streptomyces yokosukanensis]|uniref:VC0807 family protein n=1 Tax=Streptomyces yokosukanensis TaxID=67386 RepID=UPI000ABF2BE3|nr:VC0807 family protein [Streptomyces yokosukanensis]
MTGTRGVNKHERASNGPLLQSLALNVVGPLAVFYGLRAAGVDLWWAVLASAVPPLVEALLTVVRERRVGMLGILVLTMVALGAALSAVTGSPRFMFAKDGWMTGIVGLVFLATLRGQPIIYRIVLSVAKGKKRAELEHNWQASPTFRHVMRLLTAVWGMGLLLDSAVRVMLAYTLPVDSVMLVTTLQYVALFVALEIVSRRYGRNPARVAVIHGEAAATAA